MSVTVSPAAANRPREWATNPATTKAVARARLSPSTRRRRSSRVTPPGYGDPSVCAIRGHMPDGSRKHLPAELPEAGVADAEVVGDLVDHRAAHLLDDLFLTVRVG